MFADSYEKERLQIELTIMLEWAIEECSSNSFIKKFSAFIKNKLKARNQNENSNNIISFKYKFRR